MKEEVCQQGLREILMRGVKTKIEIGEKETDYTSKKGMNRLGLYKLDVCLKRREI